MRAFGEVLIVSEGPFPCPVCQAERKSQLREWRFGPWRQWGPGFAVVSTLLWLLRRRGWFVRCDVCENLFHPDILDPSRARPRAEMMAKVPKFVRETTRVRQAKPTERAHSLEDLRDRTLGKRREETLDEYLGRA